MIGKNNIQNIQKKEEDKDATIYLSLVADSGYESNEEARISPKQWEEILKIIYQNDKDDK